MHYLLKSFALLFLCALPEHDNRMPKPVSPVSIADLPFALRDEVDVLQTIAASHNQDLKTALILDAGNFAAMRLKWNQRVSLKDADYVLCLFDSTGHVFPGNNPRVLILFTLHYEVAAWGSFTCEPYFDYGSILNSLSEPDTYFLTVNPSGRSGGALWFEKYLISPKKIEKLGEGPSYPVNSKKPSEE